MDSRKSKRVGRRVLKIYRYSSVIFHFVGLTEKVSRVKGKTRFIMSSYTYLALGFSNPVGAKFSRWCLGINSFGANGDLCRSYTQWDHCHAGTKLFRSYFGIISFRRQISSMYEFYTTYKFLHWRVSLDLRGRSYATQILPSGAKLFPCWVVGSDLRRSCTLRRNCTAGAEISGRHFVSMRS